MNKRKQLSLALALMMGISVGSQIVSAPSASAQISDKFSLELNGVTSYVFNKDQLGGDYVTPESKAGSDGYWNQYIRAVFKYKVDKDTRLVARIHSGYDNVTTDYKNTNEYGSYFDQAYIETQDRKANVTYVLGKKGAYLGQGLIHNSSGNLTGAQVSFGKFWEPRCLQLIAGNKKDGSRFWAANYTQDVAKNWQMSATYINHDKKWDGKYKFDQNGKPFTADENELHLVSIGTKYKAKDFTVQGEFVKNLSDNVRNGTSHKSGRYTNTWSDRSADARRAWYVEVYTGPTSDMVSGLPLQKPGTEVWSLKYQDVGANAVDSHNTTFYNDARGFRLSYGRTFKKGIAADIAIARMKDKGGSDYMDDHNGKWKNAVVAEVSYKFK